MFPNLHIGNLKSVRVSFLYIQTLLIIFQSWLDFFLQDIELLKSLGITNILNTAEGTFMGMVPPLDRDKLDGNAEYTSAMNI